MKYDITGNQTSCSEMYFHTAFQFSFRLIRLFSNSNYQGTLIFVSIGIKCLTCNVGMFRPNIKFRAIMGRTRVLNNSWKQAGSIYAKDVTFSRRVFNISAKNNIHVTYNVNRILIFLNSKERSVNKERQTLNN